MKREASLSLSLSFVEYPLLSTALYDIREKKMGEGVIDLEARSRSRLFMRYPRDRVALLSKGGFQPLPRNTGMNKFRGRGVFHGAGRVVHTLRLPAKFCETLYKRCSSLGRFGRLNRDHRALISDEKEPGGGFVVIVGRYCLARCIFSWKSRRDANREVKRLPRDEYIYFLFIFGSILNDPVSISGKESSNYFLVSSVTCIAINNPWQLKMGIGLKRVRSIHPLAD